MTKIKRIGIGAIGSMGLLMSLPALASPSSTPTEVLGTVVDNGVNSAVDLVGTVMTTYFPYVIAIIAGLALLRWVF